MKNVLKLSVSALVALFFITSCSKKEIEDVKPKEEKEITTNEIKNSLNPYDDQGELHNKFLDYFIANASPKKEINRNELSRIYEGFYKENKLEYGDVEARDFGLTMDAFAELNIGGPYVELDLCKLYPVLCSISPTGPYNPLELLVPNNGTTSTDRTLKYISTIKEIEADLLKNDKVKEDLKKALLNYYAVTRYSSAYWHNVVAIKKGKSGYYEPYIEDAAEARCHTCDIVGGDAAGAVVGAIVAGVGAGPGAGIASAAIALEKVWDWFWD